MPTALMLTPPRARYDSEAAPSATLSRDGSDVPPWEKPGDRVQPVAETPPTAAVLGRSPHSVPPRGVPINVGDDACGGPG